MLVDAAQYYAVLRESILLAERSVFILGWDVDTRTVLDPEPSDGYPSSLLEFLNQVLCDRPDLRIHVLAWDFSVIYALERERMSSQKFASLSHPRLSFALDGHHQVGASHHQKVVVVDDALAFCGGIDLTIRRWDTPLHRSHDAHRKDPFGEPYAPMHDVQLAVSGAIAQELSVLCRRRWLRATGQELELSHEGALPERWPKNLEAQLEGVDVGIARTEPSNSDGHRDVREVEQVTLRAIESAKQLVFIENQYFTATAVGEALIAQLARAGGPEVILVLPRSECGWLEQSSMGVLRDRMLAKLRAADRFQRLHVVYPHVPGLGERCVNVHSKVLIVDDLVFKVGSANMSNRSLGLDTECDLVVEAPHAHTQASRAIASWRRTLVAEHLGVSPEEVRAGELAQGSLGRLIVARRNHMRALLPVPSESSPPLDLSSLEQFVVDPERPMAADAFIAKLLPVELRPPFPRMLLGMLLLLLPVLVLAVAFHAPQLERSSVMAPLLELAGLMRDSPWSAVYVAFSVLLLSVGFCPVTLWVPLCIFVFGSLQGSLCALFAGLCSASVFYGVGRAVGHVPLSYLRGPHMAKLRAELRRRAFPATMAARLFPLGNFTLINLLAGALYVPFPAFFLGNLLGLLPGIIGTAFCADRLLKLLRQPSWLHIAGFLVSVILLGAGLWGCGRLVQHAGRVRFKGSLRWSLP